MGSTHVILHRHLPMRGKWTLVTRRILVNVIIVARDLTVTVVADGTDVTRIYSTMSESHTAMNCGLMQ